MASERNVHKFMGQKLYKFDVKLSRRAQEVAGMPLINYNLNTSINPSISTKEPLKRTISACATSDGHLPIQSISWQWPYAQSASSSQTTTMSPSLESNMPELLTKPILTEAMSMPLLQHPSVSLDEDIIAELELGDEERLLPTDLLNDDDEEDFESRSNSNSKIPLRKTWSWTPEQLPFDHSPETEVDQQENKQKSENNCENSVKSTNKKPELRQLEKAIKSLSIDPNMSISRKF